MASNVKPVLNFSPTQRRFFEDQTRVQVVNWHRQKGKDFVASAKAVDNAVATGTAWYLVSLTQRQADATFDKCRKVAKAYQEVLKILKGVELKESEYESIQYDAEIDHWFTFKVRELILPNGGKVVSLPGRDPDSLAGLTGNIIFTEFGLFPGGGYDHWRVVFPLSTRGFKVIVISTPRSKNTKFYELSCNEHGRYGIHFCDIYETLAENHPAFQLPLHEDGKTRYTLDEFKQEYSDSLGWKREYECEFTGDMETLVKWAQLQAAGELGRDVDFRFLRVEKDGGWQQNFFDFEMPSGARFELGWDVARTGHVSSLWCNQSTPGQPRILRSLVLMHNTSFALMRNIVQSAMNAKFSRPSVGCGDATGLGMQSNEDLENQYVGRWEGVNFAGNRKGELGSGLSTAFDEGGQSIPPLDGEYKFIATDIYGLQKEQTGASDDKRLKITETENPLMDESHCDIGWSAALAIRSKSLIGQTGGFYVPGVGMQSKSGDLLKDLHY